MLVINQICKHYFHGETLFQLVQQHGEPEKILLHLCKKHPEISHRQLIELFQVFYSQSTSSSSTPLNSDGPRQRQASQVPIKVKKEDIDYDKDEAESNSSKEFKELQAKCEDPEGTTYRLRDRHAAPVSPTAATAGSTRSISPEVDNGRVERQRKRSDAKAKAKEDARKAKVKEQARTIAAPTPSEGDASSEDDAEEREGTATVIAEPLADSQRQFVRNPKGPASARTTSDLLAVRSPASPASDRSSRKHDSDPDRPEAPRGHVRRRRRRGMIKGPGAADTTWPGPQEGDDKHETYLVDYAENFSPGSPRTGQARTTDSGREWSPRTAPKRPTTLRPLVDKALQSREKRRQVIEHTGRGQDLDRPVIKAEVKDEAAEPIPRAKLVQLPRPELQNQVPMPRRIHKDEVVDSGSTRPPTGKGFGEGRRQAILRSRSRSRSPTTRSSSDKRSPLLRPRDRGDSVERESGKRRRIRVKSVSPPPRRRLTGKQKPQKGKGYNPVQKGVKSKDKTSGKVKNKSQESSKGKGSHKQKHANIDDDRKLTPAVRSFHETINSIVIGDDQKWMYEVFKHYRIIDDLEHRKWVMDNCAQHVRDMRGKASNKRLYLGPGRDGSSDNKISVDVKFYSDSTKVTENPYLKSLGYCKTSFAYERDAETQKDEWIVIEDQAELDNEEIRSDPTPQMVIIIHPMYSTSVEDDKVVEKEKKAETATTTPAQTEKTTVANLAIQASTPKDDSISEEEADFNIAEVDSNDI